MVDGDLTDYYENAEYKKMSCLNFSSENNLGVSSPLSFYCIYKYIYPITSSKFQYD